MLDECGMIQSMSRVSKCIDNGPMEGVGYNKSEIFRGNKHFKFNSVEEATKQFMILSISLIMKELH